MNKEDKYKKEIFDLLADDFKDTTQDVSTLNLLKELFISDANEINNEDILKKLLIESDDKET